MIRVWSAMDHPHQQKHGAWPCPTVSLVVFPTTFFTLKCGPRNSLLTPAGQWGCHCHSGHKLSWSSRQGTCATWAVWQTCGKCLGKMPHATKAALWCAGLLSCTSCLCMMPALRWTVSGPSPSSHGHVSPCPGCTKCYQLCWGNLDKACSPMSRACNTQGVSTLERHSIFLTLVWTHHHESVAIVLLCWALGCRLFQTLM